MVVANIFTQIDADAVDQKMALGKELIALRMSVETNARILRTQVDRLKEILTLYGLNGTTPLFNQAETDNMKQVIGFLIMGGGTVAMAKVDGQPFEGMQAIVNDALTLTV